jgi:hypothetical protein
LLFGSLASQDRLAEPCIPTFISSSRSLEQLSVTTQSFFQVRSGKEQADGRHTLSRLLYPTHQPTASDCLSVHTVPDCKSCIRPTGQLQPHQPRPYVCIPHLLPILLCLASPASVCRSGMPLSDLDSWNVPQRRPHPQEARPS